MRVLHLISRRLAASIDRLSRMFRKSARVGIQPEFVVIVTFGRSGSTVLQSALNRIPGVVVRGENFGATRHLFRAFEAILKTHTEHGGVGTLAKNDPMYGAHLLQPSKFLSEMRRIVTEDILQVGPGTVLAGFKEVRYTPSHYSDYEEFLRHLLFLESCLPGLRFVMNVRDVAGASQSGWWAGDEHATQILTVATKWIRQAVADINKEFHETRAILMDYEEWRFDATKLVYMAHFLGQQLSDEESRACLDETLRHMR